MDEDWLEKRPEVKQADCPAESAAAQQPRRKKWHKPNKQSESQGKYYE
jgi:hypothetical protein